MMTAMIIPLTAMFTLGCATGFGVAYYLLHERLRSSAKEAYRWYMANEMTLDKLARCRAEVGSITLTRTEQ